MTAKSNKVSITVSQSFFEKNDHTMVTCPLCGKRTLVLVSILSVEECSNCHETIEVEFVER